METEITVFGVKRKFPGSIKDTQRAKFKILKTGQELNGLSVFSEFNKIQFYSIITQEKIEEFAEFSDVVSTLNGFTRTDRCYMGDYNFLVRA